MPKGTAISISLPVIVASGVSLSVPIGFAAQTMIQLPLPWFVT
jgi:hypothetical protein